MTTPSTSSLFGPLSSQSLTTDADITASILADYAKVGNNGDSVKEGEESKEHYKILIEDLEEQHIYNEFNTIDAKDIIIPGAPSGWIPPGPPEDWTGYQPKFDAPRDWTFTIQMAELHTRSRQRM